MAARRGKIGRSDPVKDHPEKHTLRGHALFVRFMERRGLTHCLHYFPADMTIGLLRQSTPRELMAVYKITDAKDREKILKAIDEPSMEDHHPKGEPEVNEIMTC